MKDLIPKREQLMAFVQPTPSYEISVIGELCIAQHPNNKYFEIIINETVEITSTI